MPLLPGGAGLFVFLCFSRFFCSASLRSAALLSSLSSLFARRRGRRRDRRRCAARVAPPGLKFHCLHSGGRPFGARGAASRLGAPLRGFLSASLRSAGLLSSLSSLFARRRGRRRDSASLRSAFFPGVRAADAALHPRLIRGRPFGASFARRKIKSQNR